MITEEQLQALGDAVYVLYDLGNQEGLDEEYFQRIVNVYYELKNIVTIEEANK